MDIEEKTQELYEALTNLSPHRLLLASSSKANQLTIRLECWVQLKAGGSGAHFDEPSYKVLVGEEIVHDSYDLLDACEAFYEEGT